MARKQPFFSIITCTYNIGQHLQKTIDSVQRQSFDDYEHLFIDGNSTDTTIKLIRAYRKQHPSRVRLYQRPAKGIWNAINAGNTLAKGKYILHLEGDNTLHDRKVLADVEKFLRAHPKDDWVYCKIDTIRGRRRSLGTFPNQRVFQVASSYLLKFINFIPQEAMFVKPSVFRRFGSFDESLKTCSDYEYWLRIAHLTQWRFFDRVVTNYLIRTDALSSNPEIRQENLRNCLRAQKKHLSAAEFFVARFISNLIEKHNKVYQSLD